MGDEPLGLRPAHDPDVRVLAEELRERARDRPTILVHHRDEEAWTLSAEEGLGDDGDHEDRHREREDQRPAVPQEDPKVLAEGGEHQAWPPTFARSRSTSPWKESLATAASNWARKFWARLTPSTAMSVARQPSGLRRSV